MKAYAYCTRGGDTWYIGQATDEGEAHALIQEHNREWKCSNGQAIWVIEGTPEAEAILYYNHGSMELQTSASLEQLVERYRSNAVVG